MQEASVEICGVMLRAELAQSERQWKAGLGYRTRLENGHGMLFIFDRVRPLAFTARHTYIPLSIAFIDEEGVLQEMYDLGAGGLGTERVESIMLYRLALEVPFGWFRQNNIVRGCRVSGIESLAKNHGNH